jgi:predicted metal-binding membrane protein
MTDAGQAHSAGIDMRSRGTDRSRSRPRAAIPPDAGMFRQRSASLRAQTTDPVDGDLRRAPSLAGSHRKAAAWTVVIGMLGWTALAWIALDMGHPIAQLTMPASTHWSAAELSAIGCMWAVMMAAMMLPSALPMILTFAALCERNGEPERWRAFVVAYLLVWIAFSAAAVAAQWAFQGIGWIDPMIVSRSAPLSAALLLIAGVYQFSPLKRVCLARCRTPIGFLLGEWRAGIRGSFVMGLRHGQLCLGCCWALMALLFVGGAMNLAWVAALSIAVAIEKLAPHGDRLALVLGLGLIVAGAWRLLA